MTNDFLIDTHCHLEMSAFDPDREDVIKRAGEAGVGKIITIGSDLDGCKDAVELANKYESIYVAVGIHPHDAKDFTDDVFNQIKGWAMEFKMQDRGCTIQDKKHRVSYTTHRAPYKKVVAIGETGLDYHYGHSQRDIQREVFKRHLSLAIELDLPVVIHSREAKADTLRILSESGIRRGVMHCFSGDMEMAERAMAMGLYISIAGPITFPKAARLQEIAKKIPDEYLLIETDAPYLTPAPYRGRRNEPSYLLHTAEKLAELRGVSLSDIARITTLNAVRLFGIGELPDRGTIAYSIRDSLYLNITNRCTNVCSFCARFHSDYVKGHKLRLDHEPTFEELRTEIKDPRAYKEIVFCGYGEPLLRLDLVKSLAGWIKKNGGTVRINTNGHTNIIHGRDILPELNGLVDSISISLDAQDEETYNRVCKPLYKNAYSGVIEFIKESRRWIPEVTVTVVDLPEVDVKRCEEIAGELGVRFRLRRYNVVG